MNDLLFEPCAGRNAIQQAVFGITLTEELSEDRLAAIADVEKFVELPRVDLQHENALTIRLGGDPNAPPNFQRDKTTKIVRVERKQFDPSGDPLWLLSVDAKSISVSCLSYTRWIDVKPKAICFLEEAVQSLVPPRLSVHSLLCNIVDEFWWLGSGDINGGKLLNADSEYISMKPVVQGAGLFHTYSGWYEKDEVEMQRLVRLHVDAVPASVMQSRPHADAGVRIDNFVQTFISRGDDKSLTDHMNNVFERAHDRNKEIVNSILLDEVKAQIGLEL
jgi:uncharacterized protein (TIGR04255 family)